MSTVTDVQTLLKGAEFIVRESDPQETFIPEDFDDEQRMIKETVDRFVFNEVHSVADRIEALEEGLVPALLEQLGELGLLSTHMPEIYGGIELDTNTNTLIGEGIGQAGSFSVSFGAHTGIGMLPILYFGTEAQKIKYLPKLASGKLKACYCLTEPGSGSDALAAKSRAVLSEDGKHYVLNGQKMWISNAGFADIFTVFAQVDGDHFTAFLLEREMDGLTLGAEEKKLGIKGSSTRQVFMENVKVPVENVLGEVGKGHLIAFNVLNTGRFRIGSTCLGGAKLLVTESVHYANERQQFKQPLSAFGAIKHKLAEQAIRCFVTDSAVYRTSDLIQEKIAQLRADGHGYGEAKLIAAEEYVLESSILKIIGSETLDYVVDEAVQIHGGMGYSEEGVIARAYRDSRINRIYEGTNEINRLLMLNVIFKRAMKDRLDIASPALAIQNELKNNAVPAFVNGTTYAREIHAVKNFKKVLLMVLGSVAKKAMAGALDLKAEQEILMHVADIVIDVYNAESLLLRVRKLASIDTKKIPQTVYDAILRTFLHDANHRITKHAFDAFGAFIEAEKVELYALGVRQYANYPIQNVKAYRRDIADALIDANAYCL